MKLLHITSIVLMAAAFNASAQASSEKTHETKVRLQKTEIINGVEKKIDTTYLVKGPIILSEIAKLGGVDLPELPNLEQHLKISENESKEASQQDKNNKTIVVTTEISGSNYDSIVADVELSEEIRRALKAAGADESNFNNGKTVYVATPNKTDSSVISFGKVLIVKTSKLSDLTAKDHSVPSSKTIEKSNQLQLSSIEISPNPNSGTFNVKFELPNKGDATLTVRSPEGKTIYRETLKSFAGKYDKEISLGIQSAGLYYIELQQNKKTATKKLLIE